MDAKDENTAKLLKGEFDRVAKSSDAESKWKTVMAFCDVTIRETNGPVHAVKLLSAEMLSANEEIALRALEVLEACVRRCGPRFQAEVGKFRFLNEIVKLVSPRYLGKRTTERVKSKSIELLYVWTQLLPHEPKIKEAYEMLKDQKLIDGDPDVPLCTDVGLGSEKDVDEKMTSGSHPSDDIFKNDERSQRLKKLLQSRNAHDLQEANKLIKKIVSENEQKQAKVSWRVSELSRVQTIVGVLNDMLSAYQPSSSVEEKETLKQLYNSCLELRPGLQRIAEQTDDGEKDAFVNIVNVSEELDAVIQDYEFVVDGKGSPSKRRKSGTSEAACLLDLDMLNLSPEGKESFAEAGNKQGNQSQLLEEVFGSSVELEKINGSGSSSHPDYLHLWDFASKDSPAAPQLMPQVSSASKTSWEAKPAIKSSPAPVDQKSSSSVFEDIEKMARDRLSVNNLTTKVKPSRDEKVEVGSGDTSAKITPHRVVVEDTRELEAEEIKAGKPVVDATSVVNLNEISLSLDDVIPGDREPVELVSTSDVSLSLVAARAGTWPDLSVAVLTFANKSKSRVSDYVFKAVVTPKTVPVRVLPPDDGLTGLPPCRPFVPPPMLTQLLLASNPKKVPLSLKFVVCYTKNDDELESERGAVEGLIF